MSYLQLDNLESFTKCVISFWFRVPQSSINKASASDDPLFGAIVPLVSMSKEGTGQTPYIVPLEKAVASVGNGIQYFNFSTTIDGGWDGNCGGGWPFGFCVSPECRWTITYNADVMSESVGPFYAYTYLQQVQPLGHPDPTPPTFIGLTTNSDGTAGVAVNFETNKKPNVSGYYFLRTGVTPGSSFGTQPSSYVTGTRTTTCNTCTVCGCLSCTDDNEQVVDNTYTVDTTAGNYSIPWKTTFSDVSSQIMDATGAINAQPSPTLNANEWHHVLVSLDLRTISSHGNPDVSAPYTILADFVDSAALLYIAVDDVNCTGNDLGATWVTGRGPNDVVTVEAELVAGSYPSFDDDSVELGVGSYSLDGTIPAGPVGIPAAAKYVDNVYHVEMAEFQMWIGQTLDTGVEANRRLFIDFPRDSNGKPTHDYMVPVNPKKAADRLGKPNILLHGSGKWIKGTNSGSAGKFQPTGKIKSYKPDPSLPPGPQGKPQLFLKEKADA